LGTLDGFPTQPAAMNFGLEVWLDEQIESGDLQKTYGPGAGKPGFLPRCRLLAKTQSSGFVYAERLFQEKRLLDIVKESEH
jgi:hypothetical protein